MNYAIVARGGDPANPEDEWLAVFVAGDDGDAKRLVMELIDELSALPRSTLAASPTEAAGSSPAQPSTRPI